MKTIPTYAEANRMAADRAAVANCHLPLTGTAASRAVRARNLRLHSIRWERRLARLSMLTHSF